MLLDIVEFCEALSVHSTTSKKRFRARNVCE